MKPCLRPYCPGIYQHLQGDRAKRELSMTLTSHLSPEILPPPSSRDFTSSHKTLLMSFSHTPIHTKTLLQTVPDCYLTLSGTLGIPFQTLRPGLILESHIPEVQGKLPRERHFWLLIKQTPPTHTSKKACCLAFKPYAK